MHLDFMVLTADINVFVSVVLVIASVEHVAVQQDGEVVIAV